MYDPSRQHLQEVVRESEWKRDEDDDGDGSGGDAARRTIDTDVVPPPAANQTLR
jgi:hypothetical protein